MHLLHKHSPAFLSILHTISYLNLIDNSAKVLYNKVNKKTPNTDRAILAGITLPITGKMSRTHLSSLVYQCFHRAISIAHHIHFSKGFQLIFIFPHYRLKTLVFLSIRYTMRKSAVYIPTCRKQQRQYKLNSQLCNNKTLR